ncbi:MAG: hypothetical protein RL033_7810 [Pseudomonadota bacterium]|jgi:hypothetical protein
MKIEIRSQYGVCASRSARFAAQGWRSTLSLLSLAIAVGCSPSDPVSAPDTELTSGANQQALAGDSAADSQHADCQEGESQPELGDDSTGDDSTGDEADEPSSDDEEPTEDEDIAFLRENGFQTFHFAVTCSSVAEDGSRIEDADPLPVGNGRVLECVTGDLGFLSAIDAVSSTGERFCALGEVESFRGDGDDRLTVEVTDTPETGPWTLVGTHEGEEISIGTVAGFGGGRAWPIWVDTIYSVIEVSPNPSGQLCTEFFGL